VEGGQVLSDLRYAELRSAGRVATHKKLDPGPAANAESLAFPPEHRWNRCNTDGRYRMGHLPETADAIAEPYEDNSRDQRVCSNADSGDLH